MKSNVSTSIALEKLDTLFLQKIGRSEQVLLAGVATQGNYRRMLQKKQDVRDASQLAQFYQRTLKTQPGSVIDGSEMEYRTNQILIALPSTLLNPSSSASYSVGCA